VFVGGGGLSLLVCRSASQRSYDARNLSIENTVNGTIGAKKLTIFLLPKPNFN